MASGFIYAVQAPENPNYVKIGVSTDPARRLKSLQTGNPHRLALAWERRCLPMSIVENNFHYALREYRIPRGEWFTLGPLIADSKDLTVLLDEVAASINDQVRGEPIEIPRQRSANAL